MAYKIRAMKMDTPEKGHETSRKLPESYTERMTENTRKIKKILGMWMALAREGRKVALDHLKWYKINADLSGPQNVEKVTRACIIRKLIQYEAKKKKEK